MGKKKKQAKARVSAPLEAPGSGFGGALAAALASKGLTPSLASQQEPSEPLLPLTREPPPPRPTSSPPPPSDRAPARPKPSAVSRPSPPAGRPPSVAGPGSLLRGKAVVRQERKGHGGKTVTVVDGAAIARIPDLAALAKTMRKAMGTGARVDGGAIVLQGDQRVAAEAWLTKQGATVVVGN